MRQSLFHLITIGLSLIIFFSCTEPTLDFSIPHEQSVLLTLNAQKTQGAFQVKSTPFETVISQVTGNETGMVFSVQAENTSNLDFYITQGTAFWTDYELIILDEEKHAVFRFAVSGKESQLLPNFPTVYSQHLGEKFEGFGFGSHQSEGLAERVLVWIESNPGTSIFSKATDTNAFGRANNIIGGGDEKKCSSGGPGATTCSVSKGNDSCSVTCSSGYYACCSDGRPGGYVDCSCEKDE